MAWGRGLKFRREVINICRMVRLCACGPARHLKMRATHTKPAFAGWQVDYRVMVGFDSLRREALYT